MLESWITEGKFRLDMDKIMTATIKNFAMDKLYFKKIAF